MFFSRVVFVLVILMGGMSFPSQLVAAQLHGLIVNQAEAQDAKRVEEELSILWYLDNHVINANLVITEESSFRGSKDILFTYDGVLVKKMIHGRRASPPERIVQVANEIHKKIKSMDKKKRFLIIERLVNHKNRKIKNNNNSIPKF